MGVVANSGVGVLTNIQNMTSKVPLINFHRYERYEGKNMLNALGSVVKRNPKIDI